MAEEMESDGVSAVSVSLAIYHYCLVEKSVAAFAICRGHSPESPLSHHMSLVQMRLHHLQFEVAQQPEPSIQSSHTCYLCHRSSWPRLLSMVA